uniref:Pleckstrin 2 n=1 Tax=Ursus maritimus TaxID=29073 RepID=A0A452U1C6_URSMA
LDDSVKKSSLGGHIVHNWKARWFILRQNTLLYYKLEGGRKVTPPKGRILLDGCTITCPCLEYENRPPYRGQDARQQQWNPAKPQHGAGKHLQKDLHR